MLKPEWGHRPWVYRGEKVPKTLTQFCGQYWVLQIGYGAGERMDKVKEGGSRLGWLEKK